jgi:hypothetical protein
MYQHSIDVTFHRLYLVIAYKVIDDFVDNDEVYVNQKTVGSIYYTHDERLPKDKRFLFIWEHGPELISDFSDNRQELKKFLLNKMERYIHVPGINTPMQITLSGAWRANLPETKRYRLDSRQMCESFARALGASGLATKYASGRTVHDTTPVQLNIPDHFSEEPIGWTPVLRLDER